MKGSVNTGLQAEDFERELLSILDFWSTTAFDRQRKRFYGKVDNHNRVFPEAALGSVVYARILWSFSAGYAFTGRSTDKEMATHAWEFIDRYFIDPEYGGVYWELDAQCQAVNQRKQIYAIAFTIYAIAEYHRISPSAQLIGKAIALFELIEKYSFDPQQGGYFEAFSRDWSGLDDQRLSEKDQNDRKTMNTHLHILEAYSNLYRVWPDRQLKERIGHLLDLFGKQLVSQKTGHLLLFHNEQWAPASGLQSFGHDIEASWLLCEAAELINETLPAAIRALCIRLAGAASEGIDSGNALLPGKALLYEFDDRNGEMQAEKHWWVQAEAIVGFYNASGIASDERYAGYAAAIWQYARQRLLDPAGGEWFWGRDARDRIIPGKGKVDFWKGPYHTTRCCLEMIRRLVK